MKYRIRDLQFDCKYFANGEIFNNKKEVCERLIAFHSIDCNMEEEQKLFDEGKIDKCFNALKVFEWELEEIK